MLATSILGEVAIVEKMKHPRGHMLELSEGFVAVERNNGRFEFQCGDETDILSSLGSTRKSCCLGDSRSHGGTKDHDSATPRLWIRSLPGFQHQ